MFSLGKIRTLNTFNLKIDQFKQVINHNLIANGKKAEQNRRIIALGLNDVRIETYMVELLFLGQRGVRRVL